MSGHFSTTVAVSKQSLESKQSADNGFNLLYAPHFGMFKNSAGKDFIDQLKFMHDQGFRAMEDNGMMGRTAEEQERITRAMSRLGMTMGVFVSFSFLAIAA